MDIDATENQFRQLFEIPNDFTRESYDLEPLNLETPKPPVSYSGGHKDHTLPSLAVFAIFFKKKIYILY